MNRRQWLCVASVFFLIGLVWGAVDVPAAESLVPVTPPAIPRPVPEENPHAYCHGDVYAVAMAIRRLGGAKHTACEVATYVMGAAKRHGLDPYMIVALGYRESSWRLNTRGSRGERGPLQVMPATARSLGVQDLSDWRQTLDAGAAYFAKMLKRAQGDLYLALAYYNAGPSRGERFARKVSGGYAQRVLSTYRSL